MKETGIIMSGNHPKLILDGIKTMTRRTGGLNEINKDPDKWICHGIDNPFGLFVFEDTEGFEPRIKCPYGQVGDRLIIKETWATENRYNHLKPSEVPRTAKIWYLADENYNPQVMGKVRSSMFMCNWMSRARPEITEVRAEKLQEITLEDCKAEGIHGYTFAKACLSDNPPDPRWSYIELWDSLNTKRGYGWETNPWVRVISFKLVSQ